MNILGKAWTDKEVEYLCEYVGSVRVETLAKNLHRPVTGVLLKMKRLGISNTKKQLGYYTLGELAGILKVDRKTVSLWAEKYDLPYIKRKTRSMRDFRFIDTSDFWDWAYQHQDRIDFSKVERHALPPEPEWVEPLRHMKRKIKGNYYRPWTINEERKLIHYRNKGLTFKNIASIMNRTSVSLEKKYKRLLEQNTDKNIYIQ